MNTTITIYTTPNCGQCNLTKKLLETAGVQYTPVDLTQDEAAHKYVTDELGYTQAPIVVTDNDHWSGFRPTKLNALIAEH
ncbi:MAG: glutaredoxin family protein [Canibacter sp.]